MEVTTKESKQSEQMVNGVNVEQLTETIKAIQGKSEIARFQFRATNEWINGGHNRSTIKDFYGACQVDTSRAEPFVLDNGEPAVLLGEDTGANPVEFVLHGLAGCLTTSLVYHAAARGIEIKSVESTLEGDLDLRGFLGLDPSVRNGYEGIRVKFKVEADAPKETIRELVDLAQKRSPVFDTVTNPVKVTVSLDE